MVLESNASTPRMVWCIECRATFTVCRLCDGGNKYCSEACRGPVRREQVRSAGQRYAETDRGRAMNAARQRRHRARQLTGVTHHNVDEVPKTPEEPGVPQRSDPSVKVEAPEELLNNSKDKQAEVNRTCVRCGCQLGPFFRNRPLSWTPPKHRRTNRQRNGRIPSPQTP